MNKLCILISAALIASSAVADEEADTTLITISEVAREELAAGIPAAGTVFSRNAAQITAGLDARLLWVAEPGDFVAAGEPVARFDCDMIELRREEQVAQSQREQIRLKSLANEIDRLERAMLATSVLQVDRVRAQRDLAHGEIGIIDVRIRQIENTLQRCEERAPFAGVVTAQLRRGGEDANRGDVLATMTDTQMLEVRASVPIRYLPRMATGSLAEVQLGDVRMEGLVRTAVPAADASSQTFEVRVDLPAEAPALVAAGQLVSVRLPLAANPTLTVPRDAIVLREDGTFVMRIRPDNTAQSVPVEVADASGERVSVRGQLEPGDLIAVRGAEALDEGDAVQILAGP